MTPLPGRFWLGVAAYLSALPFLPPQLAALVLMALAAWFSATGLRRSPANPADLWPVLPFLAAGLLAATRAESPMLAAGLLSFQIPGLIIFVLTAATGGDIDRRGWMRLWTLFCLVVAGSVFVGRLRLALGAPTLFGEDVPQAMLRLSGNTLLVVPNDVCATTILAAFPLGLLAGGARGVERGLALSALVLALLATSLVRSRTGVLIAGVETAIAALLQPRLWRVLLPLLLLAASLDLWFASAGVHKLLLSDPHDLHGVAGRLGLWVAAWDLFLTAPLLGHGAQSFGPLHFAFLPDWAPHYPEGHAPWAHNLLLDILTEQGLLGAAAFLCLVVPPVLRAWRGTSLPALRADSYVALSSLTGFAIAACLELSLIRRMVPLLMFGLLGFAIRLGVDARLATSAVSHRTAE